jgi:protein-L-isoaspartate(D-aspartate) O-methyltransferase
MATLLCPENMYLSLSLDGLKKFLEFYSLEFDVQRNCLVEVIQKTLNPKKQVLDAVRRVPLEMFVPKSKKRLSYWNGVTWYRGLGGTTPPWLSAYACEFLGVEPGTKILTIGFGYGYLECVMSETTFNKAAIYSVEIDENFLKTGIKITKSLGYRNFHLKLGDGIEPWNGETKFDLIWPTLSCKKVPPAWTNQLEDDGRVGLFRPLSQTEFDQAKLNKWEGWAGQAKSYSDYMAKWWTDLCLSIYKKESDQLIEMSRLYEMDNPPIFNEEYGSLERRRWGQELGQRYETELLKILISQGQTNRNFDGTGNG